jgi:hypothetical protein
MAGKLAIRSPVIALDFRSKWFAGRCTNFDHAGFTFDTYYRIGTHDQAGALARTWLFKWIQVQKIKRNPFHGINI